VVGREEDGVADLHEAGGEHVEQDAADEFGRGERDSAAVLDREADAGGVDRLT